MTLRTLAVALLLCSGRSDNSAATVDSTDANFNTESAEDELAWDEMDSDLAWDDIDEVEADPATVRALFERLDVSRDGRLDVAELQNALDASTAQAAAHAASLSAAGDKCRAQAARAEQLTAEKAGLAREHGILRSEAVASRERADVLQRMLTQRTEYMRKLQLAAAKREEQLVAQFAERERAAVAPLEEQLSHEAAQRSELARQLEEVTKLHAEAERKAATRSLSAASRANELSATDGASAWDGTVKLVIGSEGRGAHGG